MALKSLRLVGIACATLVIAACGPSESGTPLSPESRRQLAHEIGPIKDAAAEGNPKTEYRLALAYMHGAGRRHDDTKALAWFRKAAAHGVVSAEGNLGAMYLYGWGVPADGETALEWTRKAAGHGNAIAQYNLGIVYANGYGVPVDFKEAEGWFLKSANQDYPPGQYNAGLMAAKKHGEDYKMDVIMGWLRRAADHGHPYAQDALSNYYLGALPPLQDDVQSFKWLSLAMMSMPAYEQDVRADQRERLAALTAHMTPEQLRQGQALVESWKRIPEPDEDRLGP